MNTEGMFKYLSGLLVVSVAALAWAMLATLPRHAVGIPEPALVVQAGIPLARWCATLSGFVVVGCSLALVLLGDYGRDRSPSVTRRLSRVMAGMAGVWVVAALLGLWLQTADAASRGLILPVSRVAGYVGHVTLGRALLVSASFAIGVVVCSVMVVRRPRFPAAVVMPLGILGLLAVPMSGHASQWSPRWLLLTADGLHVAGAALWVGGLAACVLVVSPDRNALSAVLPGFSRVATVSFGAVAISGVILGTTRLTGDVTPPVGQLAAALVGSDAGVVLIGKLACLAVLGCSGAYIRQRLVHAVGRRQAAAVFVTWASFELILMAVAIALGTAVARPL